MFVKNIRLLLKEDMNEKITVIYFPVPNHMKQMNYLNTWLSIVTPWINIRWTCLNVYYFNTNISDLALHENILFLCLHIILTRIQYIQHSLKWFISCVNINHILWTSLSSELLGGKREADDENTLISIIILDIPKVHNWHWNFI